MLNSLPIPFHIEMRCLSRGGQTTEHSLKFGVIGVEEPAAFIIASDQYSKPRIVQHDSHGDLDLHDDLIDALAVLCFRLLASAITEQDGESGWWTIPDIRPFIGAHLSEVDGDPIKAELARHITDGSPVSNVLMIVDEDAALDAIPIPYPFEGTQDA